MADQRELFHDSEEAQRVAWAGIRTHMHVAMPCIVSTDSDGHTCTLQPAVKRADVDGTFQIDYNDHPLLTDVPVHFPGGGGLTSTHPVKDGDEALAIFSSRSIDAWHQSGDVQNPIFNRMHSMSDAMMVPGWRSDPRKLPQMSTTSAQTRTDDKKSVIDHGPDGTKIRTVDPATAPASDSFDPFMQATKFYDHSVSPTDGHSAAATDGATTHSTTLTHTEGFKAQAANGAHTVTAHPTDGTGVSSTVAHTISAPNASLDKQGNLTNQGTHAAQGAITSATSMGAPSGNFASGSIGGVGFGGSNPILSMLGGALQIATAVMAAAGISSAPGQPIISGGDVEAQGTVQGATLRSTTDYTVATLPTPSLAIRGTRAHVTDANGPTFLQPLVGGGAVVCPAFCDGVQWVAA